MASPLSSAGRLGHVPAYLPLIQSPRSRHVDTACSAWSALNPSTGDHRVALRAEVGLNPNGATTRPRPGPSPAAHGLSMYHVALTGLALAVDDSEIARRGHGRRVAERDHYQKVLPAGLPLGSTRHRSGEHRSSAPSNRAGGWMGDLLSTRPHDELLELLVGSSNPVRLSRVAGQLPVCCLEFSARVPNHRPWRALNECLEEQPNVNTDEQTITVGGDGGRRAGWRRSRPHVASAWSPRCASGRWSAFIDERLSRRELRPAAGRGVCAAPTGGG
jgi:hypothetical protein